MISYIQKIDIKDRNTVNTYNKGFAINFNSDICDISGFSIDFIQISNTFYQMNSNYNTLKLNFSSVNYTITITPGNYTSSELLVAIKNQLVAIDAGFDITLGTNSQLITISHASTNFTLSLATSKMNKVLGFGTTNLTGATSYTATNYFNNSWPQIQLHSKSLSNNFAPRTSWGTSSEYLESIKLEVTSGDIQIWEPNEKKIFPLDVSAKISNFDFYFVDPNGNYIDDVIKGIFIIQLCFYK